MSKWRSVTSGVPQGDTMLELVRFKNLISVIDCGIKCTLNNFADDNKLSGAAGSLEGTDPIQRDLERFEEWVHVNFMKFNKAMCKVQHLGWGSTRYQYRLED